MKTDLKDCVIWLIVWMIFLFGLISLLATGVAIYISSQVEVLQTISVPNDCEVVQDSIELEVVEEEIKPLEVADPLNGEELYRFYISQIHEQYYPEVDPYIALAVLETESNYHPNVISSVGAVGLMQIIPRYHLKRAEKYGLNDPFDPYTNIICGMDFLNELIQTRGTWERALLGYNNSRAYVNKVLSTAKTLKGGNYFG